MTHKQIKALNKALIKENSDAWTEAPRIVKARSMDDASIQGIHLLTPSTSELDDAIETAFKDNFKLIVLHTRRTFGKVR